MKNTVHWRCEVVKKSELEKYLGMKVTITLFGNDIITGVLHKTGEEKFKYESNLYIPKNCYFLLPQSCLFKCSHVKQLKSCKKS